ncbi:bifunctional non-homologous end joining protein LigD [Mesorhizobium sp. J18]|uniref:DNA ligase D n=1 Tax=Mesorhizobium sp. J18 TaxID=935263 RepID=UPI00119A8537|nr:DNA ligase D [Mesorhizobium sp. J18]TWG98310.1 bifunctional non-homologous end joining protein LigD [Mesorhizobium sp. J18]
MALSTYRRKRNFKSTPEPRGGPVKSTGGDSYVIQKHAATRLHYDLRLEMDGSLKSWAITKGPSLVPGEKRLAVHVEDHPLEYGDFEGTIPKGEYGGGTVIVWDRGRWSPLGDAKKGYAKGHLDFEIHGEKLKGRWHLVRMARKPRDKKENWLLIKGDDEFAREPADQDILKERPESVKTGRLIKDIEGEEPGWSSKTGKIETIEAPRLSLPKKAKKAGYPGFIEPALASLKSKAPSGAKWLHEIKFDGYRLQAHLRAGKVHLLTRSGLDWTSKFGPTIVRALAGLPVKEAIVDGEVIVEGAGGASDFSALQADLSDGRTDRMIFYAFDLLYADGNDLRAAPLIGRKAALKTLLQGSPPVLRFSDHFEEDGELVLRHACRLSLEGVVSKDRDAPYRSGRGKDWIKSKCSRRQEFVIAGYVPSTTSAKAIGSLVLGYYDKKDLIYAGRVGTGFNHRMAADLFKKLQKTRIPKSPFATRISAQDAYQARYVEPQFVAEVEFRAWTTDGIVRHASFRGLREDKRPEEIVREATAKEGTGKEAPSIKLTHPDRLYWKDAGITKQGLVDYYSEVWSRMGPFVVNRPLALLRCPNGVGAQCFFQKHAWRGQSKEILKAFDPQDDEEPIIAIDGLPGLLGLVQGGVLEIHPWGSSLDNIEKPDMIVMDLDPGPDVAWETVIEAAREVRQRLRDAKLESFVKTSGGKGLHVVAPLKPRAEWAEVKAFAKSIAEAMAADSPESYVATVTKSKRKNKILVDYLRNGRGATAVAPYSTRARPGAAVSMPLEWGELSPAIGPGYFTVENALPRLGALTTDPWADFRKAAAPLGQGLKRAA